MRIVLPLSISCRHGGLAGGLQCLWRAACRPAPQSASGGRQCIYTPNISGFRRGPGDTVVINTNSRDYYEFRTQALLREPPGLGAKHCPALTQRLLHLRRI